jgi:sodium-dependent phosphate cotransporter
MIFYPAELFFGLLTTIALQGSNIFVKAPWLNAIPNVLETATPWIPMILKIIPPWLGIIAGAGLLILALNGVENYMTEMFNMPRSWNLIRATFAKPLRSFLAGLLFTIVVPSTTVMVSLLVPLAASGVIGADYYILPYIIGANIGTVFDVMMAAFATGDPVALGVWIVHLSVNIFSGAIFLPLLKQLGAIVTKSTEYLTAHKMRSIIFIIGVHLFPVLVVLLGIIL